MRNYSERYLDLAFVYIVNRFVTKMGRNADYGTEFTVSAASTKHIKTINVERFVQMFDILVDLGKNDMRTNSSCFRCLRTSKASMVFQKRSTSSLLNGTVMPLLQIKSKSN